MGLSAANRAIIAIMINNVLMGLAMGMFFPLIPLRLDEAGVSAGLVGLNAASSSVATLVVAPLIGFILSRRGYSSTLLLGITVFLLSIMAMSLLENYWYWTGLRFIAGLGIALHWVVIESWLNQVAADDKRGRILSIYMASVIGGNAVGAILLDFSGTSGATPFYIITLLSLLSLVCIPFARSAEPDTRQIRKTGVWSTLKIAPRLMSAGLMMGIAQGCAFTLLAYYGVQAGLTQKQAIWMHALYLGGGVILAFPVGWAVDRFDRHKMVAGLALLSMISSVAMHLTIGQQWLFYLVLFLGGGVTYGVYTAGLSLLGMRFQHRGMAAANAAFVMTWELGTMSGGPLAGTAIELFGPAGFPGVMVVAMGFVVFISLRQPRTASAS
ncbi:MAG: MFS transporter [Gammaproteobacteria bacterium]|nr:MFS transporter [Gammaproteobacteria bacterium]